MGSFEYGCLWRQHPAGCTSAPSLLFYFKLLCTISFSSFLPFPSAHFRLSPVSLCYFALSSSVSQWFLLLSADSWCVSVLCVWGGLTLWEARRIVINVCDHNGDCGGSGETTHLSCHVCCLDDQLITILCFTVQICHRCHDDP